jgi:two-component system CheB/CheR fusion protein
MNLKFVVAIGYSEGGLDPLLTLFDHVPHDQATYVILRHIPMDQRSVLAQVLKRHSKLVIMEVENGMAIENDIIYIPPSHSYITIKNNKLNLHARVLEPRNQNDTINIFLKSLALSKGEKSIAVILSGNGTDGATGAVSIYEAGGVVIVQKPETCSYPAMPQNVIDTACVHEILLPSEMPDFITKRVHPILKNANKMKRLKHNSHD